MNRGPQVSAGIVIAILCLAIGAAAGYYARFFMEKPGVGGAGPVSSAGRMGSGGGMPGMGSMGGGMGGPMMGGMGGGPQSGMQLARTVRSLNTIEQVQGQGLTPQQAQSLLPVLQKLKSAEKLTDAEAKAQVDAIQNVLTEPQKQALESLSPQRGGRPGGGMGGPPPMGSGGAPSGSGGPGPGMSGPMAGGMGGGMGRPDPERPFASERNKKALDDLIAKLGQPGG